MDITQIDWSLVCLNLRTRYKPLSRVAKEIGSDGYALNRLVRGEVIQPKMNIGIKLLDLHFDYCRDWHGPQILKRSI